MTYKIDGFLKHTEQDDYVEGCDPATSQMSEIALSFEGSTKKEILDKIVEFFGVDRKIIELDACEEAGRIDISFMEDNNSFRADEAALNIWRAGKLDLWLVTYTGHLERTDTVAWINGAGVLARPKAAP